MSMKRYVILIRIYPYNGVATSLVASDTPFTVMRIYDNLIDIAM